MNSFTVLVLAISMVSAVTCETTGHWLQKRGTTSYWLHGYTFSPEPSALVLLKRDVTVDRVLKSIETTIRKTIHATYPDVELMADLMKEIIADVKELTAGQKVDVNAVFDLMYEAMASVFENSTPSGPYWSANRYLFERISLLQDLAKKTQKLKESGKSVTDVLEAISLTAMDILALVEDEKINLPPKT